MKNNDFQLERHPANPILGPHSMPGADAVFNCGQTMYKGKTILLVAVMLRNSPMPRMHVAESEDGVNFTIRPEPFITRSELPHISHLDQWPIDPPGHLFRRGGCLLYHAAGQLRCRVRGFPRQN